MRYGGSMRIGVVVVALATSLAAVATGAGAAPRAVGRPEVGRATPVPTPTILEQPAPRVVLRNGAFTTGATVTPAPANPFDPIAMTVEGVFRAPDGSRVTPQAFWFQDYDRALVAGREVLTPVGAPYWKLRFTPTVAGTWRWRWDVRTPTTHGLGRWHRLRVRHVAANAGFLHVSPRDSRYLAYDDGTPYFAIGENLAWYDQRGTYAYDDWLDHLAAQGVTWALVWMPSWAMGIEAADTGLGDYTKRLDRAWQLDHVFTAAADRGIAIQLVLQYHGAFSTGSNPEWATNPYNAANGGPLASPAEFFTNPTARELFVRRLRYVIARYGSYTNLEAWELWNEVDLTDGYDSATVAAWHHDMAAMTRAFDPARHPITTSFAYFFDDPTVWSQSGLDLTQLHFYSQSPGLQLFPDLARVTVDWSAERQQTYDRPVLFAELGVNSVGPAETVASDPDGIGVHDGLWAGAFGNAMGTAMPWWWDGVTAADPDRYYPMFGSVATFTRGVGWDREGFVASEPTVSTGSGRAVRAHALVGATTALLWVKDGDYRYDAPAKVTIPDATVALDAFPGHWCAAWWDTWAGRWYSIATFDGGAAHTLTMPPFTGDTAVRLGRC
ncbi:MAG: DUF5060 domain-containing protein [Acidimicrobiia bacterium]